MKFIYTSKNGQMRFEYDVADPKELFAQRSMFEIHDEECCGVCKCKDIRCDVRKSKDGQYTFYQMNCQNAKCGARLDFGQHKDMKGLFVKRDEHRETNGWYVFQGDDAQEEHAAPNGKTNGSRQAAPPAPKKPAPEDIGLLQQWIAHSKCDQGRILGHYKIAALHDLPDLHYDDCLAKVKAKYAGFMPAANGSGVNGSPPGGRAPAPARA